eukprot:264187_1
MDPHHVVIPVKDERPSSTKSAKHGFFSASFQSYKLIVLAVVVILMLIGCITYCRYFSPSNDIPDDKSVKATVNNIVLPHGDNGIVEKDHGLDAQKLAEPIPLVPTRMDSTHQSTYNLFGAKRVALTN